MTSQFLPSTLPLLPLPPPQVLFPYLRVTLTLSSPQLAVVLNSIAENARNQKLDDGARLLAVVPVVEIERRVGRWATAARVVKVDKSKEEEGMFRLVLEGLVSLLCERTLIKRLGSDYLDRYPLYYLSYRLSPCLSPHSRYRCLKRLTIPD